MLTRLQIIKGANVIPVDAGWLNMIQYVRDEVPFGKLTIEFRDGKPFEATFIKETIRF